MRAHMTEWNVCAHIHCLSPYYHVDILFCRCDVRDTHFCVGDFHIGNTNALLEMERNKSIQTKLYQVTHALYFETAFD